MPYYLVTLNGSATILVEASTKSAIETLCRALPGKVSHKLLSKTLVQIDEALLDSINQIDNQKIELDRKMYELENILARSTIEPQG